MKGMTGKKSLHLATSPYLQQHADNPVDWYPWCEEALDRARRERRPILLSIGYSACHWCHVMAQESFMDPETARLMNTLYVNIKVDREERPDLDRLYQNAHLLLARKPGGWPLTVMLTPEQVPFFAGTYFPREPRHGLPAFRDILQRVAEFYEAHPEEIDRQNHSLMKAMKQLYEPLGDSIPGPELVDRTLGELRKHFDVRYGGFGAAPKFPHPSTLQWLEYHVQYRGDVQAQAMLEKTLRAMCEGGLFDQIGGGFFRYSTDDRWLIPHFEKMLYDNGPLLGLMATAGANDWPAAQQAVEQTVRWLHDTMTHHSGAFFSSLDADTEGEEGRFYVWQPEEIAARLSAADWPWVRRIWGLDGPANFSGRWHLHQATSYPQLAHELDRDETQILHDVERVRQTLVAVRAERVAPHRDEKILGSWNALMISGLLRAAERLHRDDWVLLAERALHAVRSLLWRDGRLYASYRDGCSLDDLPPAYLDDHALLLQACLDMLRTRWSLELMEWAITLAEAMLRDFEDPEQGGFYFTAVHQEALFVRPKTYSDDAMTSGNAVAVQALLQLGYLLVEPRYLSAAERSLHNASGVMKSSPLAHMGLLLGLEWFHDPPPLILLRGPETLTAQWRERILEQHSRVWVYALPSQGRGLPGGLAGKCGNPTDAHRVVAYLCQGTHCHRPQYSLETLLETL